MAFVTELIRVVPVRKNPAAQTAIGSHPGPLIVVDFQDVGVVISWEVSDAIAEWCVKEGHAPAEITRPDGLFCLRRRGIRGAFRA